MIHKKLDIIQFIDVLTLTGEVAISPAQRAILKSIYGLRLDEIELDIFKRATGRELYFAREHSELSLLAGRQSGKTSIIAALIAIYESFRDHGVPPGQRAFVLIVAPVVQQASIAFNFIRRYMLNSPTLEQYVLKTRKNEIELKSGVVIACRPCSYITVRGVPVICAILDELAFWSHEENSANPEIEVINAIRPAMATLSNTKLIKISTPYRKEGILWSEFQRRNELDYFVWRLSSQEMNPAICQQFLDKALKANGEVFRREHLAEFIDSSLSWITSELLEPCVTRGRRELPAVSNGTYVAAVDPAFQNSDFALAILHRSDRGDITVVCVLRWTGSKPVPLDFEIICRQIHGRLMEYRINSLIGDQFCFAMLKQHFSKLGIFYREFSFGGRTRAALFGNLRQLIAQRKIAIVDDPELLRQLRSLEEVHASNGNVDIRPPRSSKDDMAVAVALAALELSGALSERFEPVVRGTVEAVITRHSSGGDYYPVGLNMCGKFPGCWDKARTCECFEG